MEEKAGRKLYVFISCPSDVEEEKRIVETACSWLTKTSLPFMGIEIVPIRWPNNIISQITGEDSQAVINKQIGSYDYDIYIGIMWTRFGDRKANGLTPTEDEFEIALNNYRKNKKPFIQFYFKLDEFSPHDTNEELQYAEVQRFKNKIRESDLGIYKDFKGRNQFEKAIQDSLIHIVKNFDSLTAPDTIVPKIQYLEVKPYLPRKACNRKDYASGQLLYYTDKYAKDTLDIVSECKRIVLVNDAGTGKTTELKRIAANFSKAESPFYPFFVSLNKYVGQSLSEYLPTGWKDVPDSKIAVILDGLDEIESKNKRDAIRQIELFAEQYPKINIIVSCRTNFYESETEQLSGTLSGFASFLLLELGEKEIGCYVKESLNEGSESFYKGVSNKRLHDLLKIPFYLVHLVELFRKNLALPSHKGEIFEQLLENRIEQDIEHYRTTIPLKEEQTDIFETLQKLALGMEVLGRNYISNDEYRQIIEDQSLRELIEHCSVWKKDDSDQLKWQFEHNNFQEYLAARILSTEPLTTLKEFMFFAPNYRKLIPSWSNTLSFLISI
ncbi:hypothetical protein KY328_05035, partial [Candidatus Woesearchaeota archaeon]|nr:hypothetical protein [Candidatus Woesearchaeota archaeon]